ncbi:MAG: hypothetical protein ACRD2G_00220 [Terriglobia bacterium]
MIDRAIGMAGLGLTIISVVFLSLFPNLNRKMAWAALVVGILLIGSAGGIAFFPEGNAQSPPSVTQGPGSAYSNGQQGGITAGTVNIAPPPRTITEDEASIIERGAKIDGSHKFLVWLTGADPDIGPYSSALISALHKGGWTGNYAGGTIASFPPSSDTGLHLCGKSDKPPEAATALLRILRSASQDVSRVYVTCNKFGANFETLKWAKYDDSTVGIIIGKNGMRSSP